MVFLLENLGESTRNALEVIRQFFKMAAWDNRVPKNQPNNKLCVCSVVSESLQPCGL